jgi:hypothetical protein
MQLNSSLLTLSVIALLLPAAFHNAVQPTDNAGPLTKEEERHDILLISHGVCKSPPVYCPSKLMVVCLSRLPLFCFSVSHLSMPKSHHHNYFHISSLFMLPLVSTRLTQELIR